MHAWLCTHACMHASCCALPCTHTRGAAPPWASWRKFRLLPWRLHAHARGHRGRVADLRGTMRILASSCMHSKAAPYLSAETAVFVMFIGLNCVCTKMCVQPSCCRGHLNIHHCCSLGCHVHAAMRHDVQRGSHRASSVSPDNQGSAVERVSSLSCGGVVPQAHGPLIHRDARFP